MKDVILSVDMEDEPRANHGPEAVKRLDLLFSSLSLSLSLLFLIGIEWNVRCLVNVVLNPFKQKRKGEIFHHDDRVPPIAGSPLKSICSVCNFYFSSRNVQVQLGIYRCLLRNPCLSSPFPDSTDADFILLLLLF